jgi:hypothetical protein
MPDLASALWYRQSFPVGSDPCCVLALIVAARVGLLGDPGYCYRCSALKRLAVILKEGAVSPARVVMLMFLKNCLV